MSATPPPDSPEALLGEARRLLEQPNARTAGLWPRAVALLARQALEGALVRYWQGRGLAAVAETSLRSQLLCLSQLASSEVAGPASYTWAALTSACHAHAYELAPTASELGGWIEAVDGLMRGLRSQVLDSHDELLGRG